MHPSEPLSRVRPSGPKASDALRSWTISSVEKGGRTWSIVKPSAKAWGHRGHLELIDVEAHGYSCRMLFISIRFARKYRCRWSQMDIIWYCYSMIDPANKSRHHSRSCRDPNIRSDRKLPTNSTRDRCTCHPADNIDLGHLGDRLCGRTPPSSSGSKDRWVSRRTSRPRSSSDRRTPPPS